MMECRVSAPGLQLELKLEETNDLTANVISFKTRLQDEHQF